MFHQPYFSYKLVDVRFDMTYLMQSKIEEFVHKVRLVIRLSLYLFSIRRVSVRFCWLATVKHLPGLTSGLGWAFKTWGITRTGCRRRRMRRWRWQMGQHLPLHSLWRRRLGALLMALQPPLQHLQLALGEAVRREAGSVGPARTSPRRRTKEYSSMNIDNRKYSSTFISIRGDSCEFQHWGTENCECRWWDCSSTLFL